VAGSGATNKVGPPKPLVGLLLPRGLEVVAVLLVEDVTRLNVDLAVVLAVHSDDGEKDELLLPRPSQLLLPALPAFGVVVVVVVATVVHGELWGVGRGGHTAHGLERGDPADHESTRVRARVEQHVRKQAPIKRPASKPTGGGRVWVWAKPV